MKAHGIKYHVFTIGLMKGGVISGVYDSCRSGSGNYVGNMPREHEFYEGILTFFVFFRCRMIFLQYDSRFSFVIFLRIRFIFFETI